MSLPCGIRNYTYAKDMAIVRTRTHWVLLIGLLVLLFAAPLYLSNYWLGVGNLIGITLIAALGLNILVGSCGQLSIGHAGFIAVGAYTAAILTNRFGQPFLVGLISAGVVSGLVGIIFGLPSVRVKGFYLAITTIAAQFIIIWVINHWGLTGGFLGIKVPYASIGGYEFRTESSQFYLIMAIENISRKAALPSVVIDLHVMGVAFRPASQTRFSSLNEDMQPFTALGFFGIAGKLGNDLQSPLLDNAVFDAVVQIYEDNSIVL